MVIQTAGLRKRFDSGEIGVEALGGVDLTVQSGEFLIIMGPSGSGKTTLLSVLGCLEPPTSGAYRLAGEDVAHFDERKAARVRRERIGFVFQGFNLLPRSTALQNVELPLVYARVSRRERRERALAALSAVSLLDRAEHLPNQLSGGQQQRVAVARAIVHESAVLLCDEPTGNLDSDNTAAVLDLLRRLVGADRAVVVVTHEAGVEANADRVIRIADGRVVEVVRRTVAPGRG